MDQELEVIYRDDNFIAINKPNGLLVHKTSIAGNVDEYALQKLRDQINRYVYPAHRLDRKTSGVLIFALNPDALKRLRNEFENHRVEKTYLAIVRGYSPQQGTIDYPLLSEKEKLQEALTFYRTLEQVEVNVPFGKHKTSRYSLVQVKPQTGRMHQIRKHFAHIFHPIIGDRPHGCNKQNKLFLDRWNMNTMLLHARTLGFEECFLEKSNRIKAEPWPEFKRVFNILGFTSHL